MNATHPDPPLPLLVAAAVVAVEGLGLAVFGALELVSVTSGRLTMGLTTTVFFLLYAALLVFCAWGLWQVRTWARSPTVLTQLIWLGVAWSFRDAATTIAVVLAVVGVVVIGGVLHPASIAALTDDPTGEGNG